MSDPGINEQLEGDIERLNALVASQNECIRELEQARDGLRNALKNAVSHIENDGENAARFSKAEVVAILRAVIERHKP